MSSWWRRLGALLAAGGVLLATGCTATETKAAPTGPTDRPPTFATTARVTDIDPVAAVDEGSQMYAYNVFQRLMTVQIGSAALKPDLASECWYIDPLTYSCAVGRNRSFTSGRTLTSADVKFSLDRAMRLADRVPGSSARMLDSIASVETPEELRVDIKLKYPDSNIGYALASPAASIVDSRTFPADELLAQNQIPVGSGPYIPKARSLDELVLQRNGRYGGANGGHFNEVTVKTYSSLELMNRAIATGTVDLLWRVGAPPQTASTTYVPKVLPGADVSRLVWNPTSPQRTDAGLRQRVVAATSELRTLRRLLPAGVDSGVDTFPVGPVAAPDGPAQQVSLAVASRNDLALSLLPKVQQALEQAGLRVSVVENPGAADLLLDAGSTYTNTPVAWLQDWWDNPLPGQEQRNKELLQAYRTAPDVPARNRASRVMQEAATADATVLPLTQSDRTIYLIPAITVDEQYKNWLGPGFQLGVWGWTT
ncbi:hypothetical protein CGZ98_04050 [Enemella evansiae]|uniref:ABC transporter substrate-binding protein n=1 Tax=Enemella evansiae TaxID=2016499 RepID=UPI000B97B370|nr:ABC transporter substrate-binding protein [Enemella evansiae]OYO15581.1 hypothetical protein CGZ98_04050 [Enemella evansiae]